MPYTIEMDFRLHRVWFKAAAVYTQVEAFQSIQDMLDHPDFQPGFDVLVDMTDIEEVPLWGDDIRNKVEFDRGFMARLGTAKWVFLAPNDLVYGLARMYQALMNDTPIQVKNVPAAGRCPSLAGRRLGLLRSHRTRLMTQQPAA